MAEEEKTEKRTEGKGKRLWRIFEKFDEVIMAGLLIPLAIDLGKRIVEKFVKKFEKKVSETLGIQIDEEGKSVGDEILFDDAVAILGTTQQKEIDDFRSELKGKDIKKAEAFVLYIAKAMKGYARKVKEPLMPGAKDKTASYYEDYTRGLEWAKKFFLRLLSRKEFDEKVKFLEDSNVFSCIKCAKESSPVVEKAKGWAKNIPKKITTSIEVAGDTIDYLAEDLAKKIEEEIYAHDVTTTTNGRKIRKIRKDDNGNKVLKDNFRYKGLCRSGLPNKKWRVVFAVYAILFGAMIACSIIFS